MSATGTLGKPKQAAVAGRVGVAWAALLGLFVFDMNDASGPKGIPHAFPVLLVVIAVFAWAAVRRGSRQASLPSAPVWLVGGLLAVGTLMIFARRDFSWGYALEDVGTLLFFSLCLWLASVYVDELTSFVTLAWFAATYSVIAVFAYAAEEVNLRPEYDWAGRWDPPYYMLFGALALLARYSRSLNARLVSAAALVPMLWLALESGNRTQFALGVLFVLLVWVNHLAVMWLVATVVVSAAFLAQFHVVSFDALTGSVQETRWSDLTADGPDASLAGRFDETADIRYHIEQLDTPAQVIFGRGHGATWQPITRVLDGAPSEVFYIHSGPTALIYRYGVLGVLFFLYVGWVAVRSAFLAVGSRATPPEKLWLLGAVGFFANYFFQNSLFDPPAVLALAVSIVLIPRIVRRDPAVTGSPSTSGLSRPS